jgi:hypothetical protein
VGEEGVRYSQAVLYAELKAEEAIIVGCGGAGRGGGGGRGASCIIIIIII